MLFPGRGLCQEITGKLSGSVFGNGLRHETEGIYRHYLPGHRGAGRLLKKRNDVRWGKADILLVWIMVAGTGFEPVTFGL